MTVDAPDRKTGTVALAGEVLIGGSGFFAAKSTPATRQQTTVQLALSAQR
jgi:hypothetical protein